MWRKFPGDADQHPRESGSSASLHTSLPARKEDARGKITCRRERVWLDTYLVVAIVVVQSYQRTTLLYHTHTEVIISWYGWNNSLQSSKSLSQTPASGFSPQTAQKSPCVLASKPLHTRFCLTHSYSLNSAAKLPFCLSFFPQSFSILFSFPHIFHSPTSSFSFLISLFHPLSQFLPLSVSARNIMRTMCQKADPTKSVRTRMFLCMMFSCSHVSRTHSCSYTNMYE